MSAADTWAKKARRSDCETPRGKPYAAGTAKRCVPPERVQGYMGVIKGVDRG